MLDENYMLDSARLMQNLFRPFLVRKMVHIQNSPIQNSWKNHVVKRKNSPTQNSSVITGSKFHFKSYPLLASSQHVGGDLFFVFYAC